MLRLNGPLKNISGRSNLWLCVAYVEDERMMPLATVQKCLTDYTFPRPSGRVLRPSGRDLSGIRGSPNKQQVRHCTSISFKKKHLSNLVHCESALIVEFSETIAVYDVKVCMYCKINEYMKIRMCVRSRSFFDLGPWSLIFCHLQHF